MIWVLEDMTKPMMALMSVLHSRGLRAKPCGSFEKAQRVLRAHWKPGDILILDRDSNNERSFHQAVPQNAWPNVISISAVSEWNSLAMNRGAHTFVIKDFNDISAWAQRVVDQVEVLLEKHSKQKEAKAFLANEKGSNSQKRDI